VGVYFRNLAAWALLAVMFMVATYQRRSDASDLILIQDMVKARYAPRSTGTYTHDRGQNVKSSSDELYNIPTQQAVYEEWRGRLLASLFQPKLYANGPAHPIGAVSKYNYVIGAIRFRTLRVRDDACTVVPAMRQTFKYCFAPYSEETKGMLGFGKFHSYAYTTEVENNAVPVSGRFGDYDGSGFVVTMPTHNRTEAFALLESMQKSHFLDWQTRAVVIDFTLYNAPLNKLCAIKLLYEFPSQGGITRSLMTLFANVYRFETTGDVLGELQQFAIAVYIVWFIKDQAGIFRRDGWKHFHATVGDVWVVAEWFNVSMIVIQIAIRMEAVITVYMSNVKLDTKEFVNFYSLAAMDEKAGTLEAFSLFLIVMRTLQFTVIHPRMAYHTYAYYISATDYLAFFTLYVVVLFPFISVGRISFGNTLERYNNVWTSFVTLVTASIGNFQVAELLQVNTVMGITYFILFVCIVFFSMMALAIAIIMSSYKTVKMELETERGKQCIQGLSAQLIAAFNLRYQQYFGNKNISTKTIYREYGEMLVSALLRSDADCNFEIDETELFDWIRGYPELKYIFGLTTPQGYLKRYDTYHRGTLLKREIDVLARDMLEKMDELEFYAEEQARMQALSEGNAMPVAGGTPP